MNPETNRLTFENEKEKSTLTTSKDRNTSCTNIEEKRRLEKHRREWRHEQKLGREHKRLKKQKILEYKIKRAQELKLSKEKSSCPEKGYKPIFGEINKATNEVEEWRVIYRNKGQSSTAATTATSIAAAATATTHSKPISQQVLTNQRKRPRISTSPTTALSNQRNRQRSVLEDAHETYNITESSAALKILTESAQRVAVVQEQMVVIMKGPHQKKCVYNYLKKYIKL
ncbi:uncharacterized protein LOC105836355 [Monomorium pharaonis]|uniref:uncharacterized protein LOC105836355 n=1 Tax=Monomorium pharaonis TaxID=307658 RepID=UPI00063F244F|nr:uncharacterized protein LOC105836355 [Monomorium pharaonis]